MSSNSELINSPSPQISKAWHLFTILIQLGHPVSPLELASRSELDSVSVSADLVVFLCKIPGSPICLTEDCRFVTVSEAVFGVLDRFVNGGVPRVLFQTGRDWSGLKLMYSRKRKVVPLDVELAGPGAKRRLISSGDRDDGLVIRNSNFKDLNVKINLADTFTSSLSDIFSSNVSQGAVFTSSALKDNSMMSSFPLFNAEDINIDIKSEKNCDNAPKLILNKELHDDLQLTAAPNDLCDNKQTMTIQKERLQLFGHDNSLARGPTLLDKTEGPLMWFETLGEVSCIVSAAPLAVSFEANPASQLFLEDVKDSKRSSAEIGSLIGQFAQHHENDVVNEANYCENECTSVQYGASRKEPEKCATTVQTGPKSEFIMATLPSGANLTQKNVSKKPKIMDSNISIVGTEISVQEPKINRKDNSPKGEKHKRKEKGTFLKQKSRIHNFNEPSKEDKQEATQKVSKISSESKSLPIFESFVIEEEEGSGGYGTVYRAKRKEDGKIFAVKCPHPNAHVHHVNNELKMLERFGGRNFVIKYEGSFKCEQSECFVLEHVEHDRPEVLKKEIGIFELQWYGYCMFRALASLHKQGVVHRDVKPGNFLFSRKLNKGYLIDFNLASDLHQKFSKSSRSGNTTNANSNPFSLSSTKTNLYNQDSSGRKERIFDGIRKEAVNDNKILLKSISKRSMKTHSETFNSIDSNNKYGSQAADSGVTSTKDPTSTRTLSADGRLKPPIIPYKGRKELINFVHETMQSPNHKEITGPVSQRKRIAAPGKVNDKLMMLTPMPLKSNGIAINGSGLFNNGKGKLKKEGPCVGTKGFRAPEVLFRSYHQSFKVDIWSAGVTLLYLIIGKSPFCGDPEQNIKEIAKLRGSEDLWEVAKLHNCESSYPSDLFDVKHLQSKDLKEWCVQNTKRPDIIALIPNSLFDLVDKCLAVNPRQRISAEEALMHRFFMPCHESLKKQRLLRRASGSDCGSQTL